MPTVQANLETAKANFATKLAEISANPSPSYSIDGQSFTWNEYYAMLTERIAAINELIEYEESASTPFELATRGYT